MKRLVADARQGKSYNKVIEENPEFSNPELVQV